MTRTMAAGVAFLVCTAAAQADWFSYQFTGKVIRVEASGGVFPASIRPGSTFTGQFAFTNEGWYGPNAKGVYDPREFRVVVDGNSVFSANPPKPNDSGSDRSAVTLNQHTGSESVFSFGMTGGGTLEGITPTPPLLTPAFVNMRTVISLIGEEGAISSKTATAISFDLAKFTTVKALFVEGLLWAESSPWANLGAFHFTGELTSLTAFPTPEPTSFALLLLGGSGLAVYRWRRRKART